MTYFMTKTKIDESMPLRQLKNGSKRVTLEKNLSILETIYRQFEYTISIILGQGL